MEHFPRKRADKFKGVKTEEIYVIEDNSEVNIVMYDLDIDENVQFRGELTQRTRSQYESTAYVARYLNHSCYVPNINTFFQLLQVSQLSYSFPKAFQLRTAHIDM